MQSFKTFLVLLFVTLLSACGSPSPTPEGTTPPEDLQVEPTPTPTEMPPTATNTPSPLVILLAPNGADPVIQTELEAFVSALAAERGLRWQLRQTLSAAEINAEADYLIAMPPLEDVNSLVAAAPDTKFLVVDNPVAEPAPNLILVRSQSASEEIEAFMGGYISALLTPDWRVGIITTEDDLDQARFIAFENGMRFFCGLCRPQYAPFYDYPFFLRLPASASDAEWRSLADFMRDRLVGTVYVSPGAGGTSLISTLASLEVDVVGGITPTAGLESNWVASLRTDPLAAYLEFIPNLLDGQSGIETAIPLQLTDVNPELLSYGKKRLVEQTLADLMAGFILPGNPITP